MIRAKKSIPRWELRRCFDNRQVRWFDEVLNGLIEEEVRYDDSACLVTHTAERIWQWWQCNVHAIDSAFKKMLRPLTDSTHNDPGGATLALRFQG